MTDTCCQDEADFLEEKQMHFSLNITDENSHHKWETWWMACK